MTFVDKSQDQAQILNRLETCKEHCCWRLQREAPCIPTCTNFIDRILSSKHSLYFELTNLKHLQFSSVQFSHSVVSDSATPRITARQASLFITISQSSLRLRSIKSVMPSSHLILCRPLLVLPSIFPASGSSKESVFHIRWPKY